MTRAQMLCARSALRIFRFFLLWSSMRLIERSQTGRRIIIIILINIVCEVCRTLNRSRMMLRCPKCFFRSVEISIAIFRRFRFRFVRRCTVVRNTFARERHFSDSPIQYVGLSEKSLSFYEEIIDAHDPFCFVEINSATFRTLGFRFVRRCTVVRNTFARERHFSGSPIQYVGLSEKSLSFYEEVIDAQGFFFFIILFCRDKHCDVSRTWF